MFDEGGSFSVCIRVHVCMRYRVEVYVCTRVRQIESLEPKPSQRSRKWFFPEVLLVLFFCNAEEELNYESV